ncbi:MAG: glycosyltransferase family 2 protein, partial [Actinomycetia bacterium]|nr:glycosyltransferase family 2 protein [Actinomycetes bacterium]
MEEHRHLEPVGSPDRPSASIVLATHSRPEFLADCVASIAAAMSEGDELIVRECCNAGAAALLAELGGAVTHMPAPHEAKSTKLNAAIRSARGEVILITDDDCRVPPDWVDAMTRPFTNPAVGVAFGPVVGLSAVPGGSPPPALAAGPAPPELWNYAHGASMAVRRAAIVDAGGFDERLGPGAVVHGEEADLVLRLTARGWTCEIADAAPVHHLDWRDDEQTMHNLLVYARGGGAYLGMGLRRHLGRTIKPFVLRVLHEGGYWHDSRTRGRWFGPRMSVAFTAGLFRGMTLPPRRFLDVPQSVSVSDSRVRVLWVTDESPDRHQGGGNIRQAMLLDALAGRVDVTLLLAGHLDDDATRARACAVLEVPPVRPRRARSHAARRGRDLWLALGARHPAGVSGAARVRRVLRPVLDRIAGDYDVVIVHHLYLAPLLPARRRAQWLLHLFDVSSERARQELAGVHGRRQR